MDKFVNQWKQKAQGGGGMVLSSTGGGVKKPGRQQRLEDLAKVHILQSSSNNPRLEEIMQIRTGIEQAMTQADAEQQILKHLRHLACFELTHELIVDSQIGPLIRQLKESTSPEIARISGNIVEKLKKVVKRQARTLFSQPQQKPTKLGSSSTGNTGSSNGRAQSSASLQAHLRPSTAAQPTSSAPAAVPPTPCAQPGSMGANLPSHTQSNTNLQAHLRPSTAAQPSSLAPAAVLPTLRGNTQPHSQPGSASAGINLPDNTWGSVSMPAWGEGGASTISYPAPANTSSFHAPTTSTISYPAPANTSSYHAPNSAISYPAPANTSSYHAPNSASSFHAPTHTSSYTAPTSTSSFHAPTNTSSYAAPANTHSYTAPANTSQVGMGVGFGQGVLQQGQLPQHGYHQPLVQQNGALQQPQQQQQQQQYGQHMQLTGLPQHTQPPWGQQQQQVQPSMPWQQQHLPACPAQSSILGTASAPGSDTGGGVAGRWMQRKKVPGKAIVIE